MVPKVIVGKALTVPLADTFCEVAPELVTVILPLGEPLAELVILA